MKARSHLCLIRFNGIERKGKIMSDASFSFQELREASKVEPRWSRVPNGQ